MANRLASASSPYLRQHADNPVDWREWSPEAFGEARDRDVPVFLSVGYSACHWCHVMAHESFEDDAIAELLNRDYVAVKVDREERPDVDAVYMDAVQAMTGHGGWPMSVFLAADGTPFYGGTYWPSQPRQGMPGFGQVLAAITAAWRESREEVLGSGAQLAARLREHQRLPSGSGAVDADTADVAAALCVRAWDRDLGGFGPAPKFPSSMVIDFLLAHAVRTGAAQAEEAALHSLDAMSRGGIYDHVDSGFARYSTDARWLIPHFEKMLYDNALLLRAYVHGWQVSGRPRLRRVAGETAAYLVRDLQQERGGLSSSTDADSEGEEGLFFVWTDAELREVVAEAGEDPDAVARLFGVTPRGNFPEGPPGANVLSEPVARDEDDAALASSVQRVRAALHARRETRVHPGLDDKVLTSWNGLAIGALAEAGAVLGDAKPVEAAQRAARFLRAALVVDGRLHHTWRDGHGASVPAFLEDVACLAQGLVSLFEADGDPAWLSWAVALADEAEERFADPDAPGTYFATAHDAEALLTRPKDLWDNATPAGASVLVDVGLRLGALTGEARFAERAERTLRAFLPRARQAPTGYGELLRGLERLLGDGPEVAIVGTDAASRASLVAVHRERLRPADVLAVGAPGADGVPLLQGRGLVDGASAAYVCRHFACERPVTTPEQLRALLG